jgi:uncharacterized phage protein (predicted DNA packaging)
MVISLDQVKEHLYVEHDEDDSVIAQFIDAAKTYVEAIGVAATPSPVVDQAMLMLVGAFYVNREDNDPRPSQAHGFAIAALLAPYRKAYA